ncbi:37069_t:CDS:1, partial [Racocetra persica]
IKLVKMNSNNEYISDINCSDNNEPYDTNEDSIQESSTNKIQIRLIQTKKKLAPI